jgi:hypothetical protein
MKRACSLFIVSVMALSCLGQRAVGRFEASLAGPDRIAMVKNSIDIPAWHENSFWPMYENYLSKIENISQQTSRTLFDLGNSDQLVADEDALHVAKLYLDFQKQELRVKQDAFAEVGAELNGVIALQFIQTEILMDMMQSAKLLESTRVGKYKFYPHAVPSNQYAQAKRNIIAAAIKLQPDQAVKFFNAYTEYEEECSQTLGENYDIYGLYSGEPSDYTPGLAKRLGYNLLDLMSREISLKERYFIRINNEFGPAIAAKFLAWESYNSLINKMYAWSDGI